LIKFPAAAGDGVAVRERDRETPIFMITAYGSVQAAVDALKAGADDYFPKPFENDKLIREIEGVIARRRLEHENTHLKRALKQRYSFPNIIGKSDKMLRVFDLVGQVASSRATILITGETGTGKFFRVGRWTCSSDCASKHRDWNIIERGELSCLCP
jgi:DNA-binding NtrC family response regulator